MTKNVGGADKIVRLILGVILLVVAFVAPVTALVKGALLVIAAIALVTGLVGFCPLNSLLGLNTCKVR